MSVIVPLSFAQLLLVAGAVLLGAAGAVKLKSRELFFRDIRSWQLVSTSRAWHASAVFPASEMFVGLIVIVFLLAGLVEAASILLATVYAVLSMGALSILLLQRRNAMCGCFGRSSRLDGWIVGRSTALSLLFLVPLAMACGGSDSSSGVATSTSDPTANSSPSAIGTASPLPPDIPGHDPSTRTGNASLDAVISAIVEEDQAALLALIESYEMECVTEQVGIPAPPLCPEGVPEGSLVEVLPTWACPEGRFTPVDELEQLVAAATAGDSRPYAVVKRSPASPSGLEFPGGEHVVIVAQRSTTGVAEYDFVRAEVTGGRIVTLGVSCPGQDPSQLYSSEGTSFVLPPPND